MGAPGLGAPGLGAPGLGAPGLGTPGNENNRESVNNILIVSKQLVGVTVNNLTKVNSS